MPIILSNRLKAMQDAAENFGDSVMGIRAAQKKAAQQALEEQRAAAQEQRSQEAHTVTMGRQKTAAGLEDIQFGQAKAQEAAGAEARSMASELEGFGQAVPDQEITLPGFAAQASGPSAVVTDAGEGLKDRLRASMHNAGLRAEGKNEGFVSAGDIKTSRVKTAAEAEMKKKKDAADLAGTEAGTAEKVQNAKKTAAEVKKLDAEIANLAKGGIDPEKAFAIEDKIATKFMNQNSGFAEMGDGIGRVRTAAKNPDGPGDMALIYGYMKILDPKTGIKEGEVASAQNAGSIPQSVIAAYNKAVEGTALNPTVRTQFVNRAEALYAEADRAYQESRSSFQKLATSYGVNPNNATPDISRAHIGGGAPKQFKSAREAMASGLPAGTRVMINGEEAEL